MANWSDRFSSKKRKRKFRKAGTPLVTLELHNPNLNLNLLRLLKLIKKRMIASPVEVEVEVVEVAEVAEVTEVTEEMKASQHDHRKHQRQVRMP